MKQDKTVYKEHCKEHLHLLLFILYNIKAQQAICTLKNTQIAKLVCLNKEIIRTTKNNQVTSPLLLLLLKT